MWKLKKYKTAPTYEEYKWGEYEEKIIYCEDSSEFTITPLNYWEGTIEITSASTSPTYIFGPEKKIYYGVIEAQFDSSQIDKMWFNGELLDEPIQSKVLDIGTYEVRCLMKNNFHSANGMFYNCWKYTKLDVSHLNTSKVTDMNRMFYNCEVSELDVSRFDTSNVTDMESMFEGVNNVENLDVSKFNTSKVLNMTAMFGQGFFDYKFKKLDVGHFDTSNVLSMAWMFMSCSNLEEIDVSKWDVSKVTLMTEMFEYCSGLTSLDLSSWNMENVCDLCYFTAYSPKLQSLNMENLNCNNVSETYDMLDGCESLIDLKLPHINNIVDSSYSFRDIGVEVLDLSTYNGREMCENSGSMFNSMVNLKEIILPNDIYTVDDAEQVLLSRLGGAK